MIIGSVISYICYDERQASIVSWNKRRGKRESYHVMSYIFPIFLVWRPPKQDNPTTSRLKPVVVSQWHRQPWQWNYFSIIDISKTQRYVHSYHSLLIYWSVLSSFRERNTKEKKKVFFCLVRFQMSQERSTFLDFLCWSLDHFFSFRERNTKEKKRHVSFFVLWDSKCHKKRRW